MVEIPRAEPGKLHLAGKYWRHAKLRQSVDLRADGSVEQVNARRDLLPVARMERARVRRPDRAATWCCGVATRLPKKPGTQKLTPFSSACATPGRAAASIAIDRPAPVHLRRTLSPRLTGFARV